MDADLASPAIFGARLHRERKRQGLTLQALALKAGLRDYKLIMHAEKATRQPGIFSAARIAAALGLSLDALLAPAECESCDGLPPAGSVCPDCGKQGGAS